MKARRQREPGFSKELLQLPTPFDYHTQKVSSTFLPNLSVFWHINEGIEEIMAVHVHPEMTRNWMLVYLRLFLLIVIVSLSLLSFPNKTKNLMDRTHPWPLGLF